MRPSFFHHLHPPTIPADQARWRYTLGAGGIAIYLALVIFLTGALEMFYYVATPQAAALSNQTITFLIPFGKLIRQLHFWASQALVGVALIHLFRVIYTGAYAPPRRFNYLLGLFSFLLILLLDFSGYILRWDDGIRWALVVGTNIIKSIPWLGDWLYRQVVGGSQPGLPTLTRFYAAHIFTLILGFTGVTIWHIFRVRRDGGISVPPAGDRPNPHRTPRSVLVYREFVAVLLVSVVLLLLAEFLPAPLAAPIRSLNTPDPDARAPWFFIWVQGLVRLGDPFWMGVIIPLAVLGFFALIPFIFPSPAPAERGRWFPRGGRLAQVSATVVALLIIVLTVWTYFQ